MYYVLIKGRIFSLLFEYQGSSCALNAINEIFFYFITKNGEYHN